MPILITGLFGPSGGAGSFDLYAPEDIQAGDVNVILQAVAGGSFKGGSHATSPAGEIVAQVKTTTGAPTHSASLGTLCWNSVDLLLYTNNNGATGWTLIGTGGGPAGPMGIPGFDGTDGLDGFPGPPGQPGAAGATGATGVQGPAGVAGSSGPPGFDGLDGADGQDAIPGPVGPAGAAGATGAQGSAGLPGLPGMDGLDGPDGIDGPPGAPGSVGATGAAGSAGAAGPAGSIGMLGLDGEPGFDGFPGPIGPAGGAAAYSVHDHLFAPDAAPATTIVAGDAQGMYHHSGPDGETAFRLYVDAKTAPGASGLPVTVQYGDTDDLDTVGSWTTIATYTLSSEKSNKQDSMTNATIPANRLIRCNWGTIVGTPRDGQALLRVLRPLRTAVP